VLQIDLQPLQNISSICPWFTKLKMVTFHCHVHLWEGRLVLLFLVPRLLQQFLAQPVRSGFELTPSEEFKHLCMNQTNQYSPNKQLAFQPITLRARDPKCRGQSCSLLKRWGKMATWVALS
jgi:hypothetical protein